ncbi:TetR family transcriptional regulator [Halopseudomonas oceani]|uniref:TetR family transcriptional regulator n=1 Tax=Halopseudomonas oceani TaxID=1708783 RepID=UPI002AA67635|nr:TetR family transcriptional regulator [Halopseudomonas oceani]
MARRTKEEAFETRESILDAAEKCFHEKGVSRTSLSEIAQAAGVTRGAIYWHFQDKADLLDALFQRIQLPMAPLNQAAHDASASNPLERFRELLVTVLKRLESDPAARRVNEILLLKCDYVEAPSTQKKHLQSMNKHHDDNLRTSLLLAMASGELPADLDLEMALFCAHSFIYGILHQWLMQPQQLSLVERADDIAATLLDMLRDSPHLRSKSP